MIDKGLGPEMVSFSQLHINSTTHKIKKFFLDLYEKAVSGLMKSNQMLHFAYADFEEERRKYDNAKKIYDRLLSQQSVDPSLVNIIFLIFQKISFLRHIFN